MVKRENAVISAVRYICLIGLVVAGLLMIIACDGDDGKVMRLTYAFGAHGTYTYEDDTVTIHIADSDFPDSYGFEKGAEILYTVSFPADREMTWTNDDEEIQWLCTGEEGGCYDGMIGWWSDDNVRDFRIRIEIYEDGTFVLLGTND